MLGLGPKDLMNSRNKKKPETYNVNRETVGMGRYEKSRGDISRKKMSKI